MFGWGRRGGEGGEGLEEGDVCSCMFRREAWTIRTADMVDLKVERSYLFTMLTCLLCISKLVANCAEFGRSVRTALL